MQQQQQRRLALQRRLQQQLKLRGVAVAREALQALVEHALLVESESASGGADGGSRGVEQRVVDKLMEGLGRLNVHSQVVTADVVSQIFPPSHVDADAHLFGAARPMHHGGAAPSAAAAGSRVRGSVNGLGGPAAAAAGAVPAGGRAQAAEGAAARGGLAGAGQSAAAVEAEAEASVGRLFEIVDAFDMAFERQLLLHAASHKQPQQQQQQQGSLKLSSEGGRHGHSSLSVAAPASSKADVYRVRLQLLLARTERSAHFALPLLPTSLAGAANGRGGSSSGPAGGESRGSGALAMLGQKEITTVQALVGEVGRREAVVLLGVVSQLEDGRFFLEDLSGVVPLDLSRTQTAGVGLYTENSVVLAEGLVLGSSGGVFQVLSLALPPLETRGESMALLDTMDAAVGLGTGPNALSPSLRGEPSGMQPRMRWARRRRQRRRRRQQQADGVMEEEGEREEEEMRGSHNVGEDEEDEEEDDDEEDKDLFVFLSDVWLDQPEAVARLRRLLEGFNGSPRPPPLFVLVGNFLSKPYGLATPDHAAIRASFSRLATLIRSQQRLMETSTFLIVPGPGDPGPGDVLPRPPIPRFFAQDLLEQLPSNCILGSNPCRIRTYPPDHSSSRGRGSLRQQQPFVPHGRQQQQHQQPEYQELVVFREDLQHKLQRACVVAPNTHVESKSFPHVVCTLLHQAHLCPLPLSSRPVLWDYAHALTLFPLPDALVLADCVERAFASGDGGDGDDDDNNGSGVTCVRTSPFHRDGSFATYCPATKEVEDCQV